MDSLTFEFKQISLKELKKRVEKLDEQILKIKKTKENIILKMAEYKRELKR